MMKKQNLFFFEGLTRKEVLERIVDDYKITLDDSTNNQNNCNSNVASSVQNEVQRNLRQDLIRRHLIVSSESSLEREIQRFMERRDAIDNILHFWKENVMIYPKLAKIAKILLGIPATTSKSESAFSIAGCLIRSKRAKIEPYRAERVLFIHDNYYLINGNQTVS